MSTRSTSARGYGSAHQAERKRWKPTVQAGGIVCHRCDQPIAPDEPWDLGHSDDRRSWTGPEHAACNRADGGRKAAANPRRDRGRLPTQASRRSSRSTRSSRRQTSLRNFLRWLAYRVQRCEIHEAMEFLKWRGRPVSDPHALWCC